MKRRYCPLWTLAMHTTIMRSCIGRECGMYRLCQGAKEHEDEKKTEKVAL